MKKRVPIYTYLGSLLTDFFFENCRIDKEQDHSILKFVQENGYEHSASLRFLGALDHLKVISLSESTFRILRPSFDASEYSDEIEIYRSFQADRDSEVARWLTSGDEACLERFRAFTAGLPDDVIWSLKYAILVVNQFFRADVIKETLRVGKCQASQALAIDSQQIFEHYSTKPHLLETYAEGFAHSTHENNRDLCKSMKFKVNTRYLDVGGGNGSQAGLIAESHPTIVSATVLDLPSTGKALEESRRRWSQRYRSRVEFIDGNFFASNEEFKSSVGHRKFDAIGLSWILHDWNDADCKSILSKVKECLELDGKLLVIEKIREPANEAKLQDFIMLLMADGIERTSEEYEILLADAGFEIVSTYISRTGRDLLEARFR